MKVELVVVYFQVVFVFLGFGFYVFFCFRVLFGGIEFCFIIGCEVGVGRFCQCGSFGYYEYWRVVFEDKFEVRVEVTGVLSVGYRRRRFRDKGRVCGQVCVNVDVFIIWRNNLFILLFSVLWSRFFLRVRCRYLWRVGYGVDGTGGFRGVNYFFYIGFQEGQYWVREMKWSGCWRCFYVRQLKFTVVEIVGEGIQFLGLQDREEIRMIGIQEFGGVYRVEVRWFSCRRDFGGDM